MNCLDVRRAFSIDPDRVSAETTAHLEQCPSCKRFAAHALHSEEVLRQALAMPVPEQLAERILLNTHLKKPRWKIPAALAASLALIASLTLAPVLTRPQADWSEVVLAHVLNERETLHASTRIAPAALSRALQPYGFVVRGRLGEIRFLEHCDLPGGKGVHAVLELAGFGRVTLILPPPEFKAAAGRPSVQREGFAARVVDIAGTPVGVVTQDPARLEALAQHLTRLLGAPIAAG